MEQLNTPHPISSRPSESVIPLSFDDYFDENSYLIRQCHDQDVMFHVTFLTMSHAIEKAMLFLQRKPNFDSVADCFKECDALIFSYQSEWLSQNGDKNWKEESLKIADNLCPTIKGRRRINEAVKIYMDKYFLMDIVLSELRQILSLTHQERSFIIHEGIPFLRDNIRLADLEPTDFSDMAGLPKFSASFA